MHSDSLHTYNNWNNWFHFQYDRLWPVNMTGKTKSWLVNSPVSPDIVRWLAVISSPVWFQEIYIATPWSHEWKQSFKDIVIIFISYCYSYWHHHRQSSYASWQSLKIAVFAGKSLNFGANVIQTKGKGATTEVLSGQNCSCCGRTKNSRLFFARNGVLEKCEMCPWKFFQRPWMFCLKKGTNPGCCCHYHHHHHHHHHYHHYHHYYLPFNTQEKC